MIPLCLGASAACFAPSTAAHAKEQLRAVLSLNSGNLNTAAGREAISALQTLYRPPARSPLVHGEWSEIGRPDILDCMGRDKQGRCALPDVEPWPQP